MRFFQVPLYVFCADEVYLQRPLYSCIETYFLGSIKKKKNIDGIKQIKII